MKKLAALFLTLAMALSLTACGGVKTDAVKKAYADTAAIYNETANTANANGWAEDADLSAALAKCGEELTKIKSDVEGGKLTQEQVDQYTARLGEIATELAPYKETVSVPYAPEPTPEAEPEAQGFTIEGTAWAMSGGMNADGVEMTQEDLDQVYAAMGAPVYQFGGNGALIYQTNDATTEGTYTVNADGTVDIAFGDVAESALMTQINDAYVLLITGEDGGTYYFTQAQ